MTDTVGSYAWALRSSGRLSWKEKIHLLRRSLVPSMVQMGRMLRRSGKDVPLNFQEIAIPDSRACQAAVQALTDCASPAVAGHSLRTYFWGVGLAQVDGLKFDAEMLWVSSLCHDLGLTDAHHDASCQCFGIDSARAAMKVVASAGWAQPRQDLLADIICFHLNGYSTPADGIEHFLLQQATAFDIVGMRYHDLTASYRQAVLTQHPRHDCNAAVTALFRREAQRRPQSRAALMHQVGLPLMIKVNPFES